MRRERCRLKIGSLDQFFRIRTFDTGVSRGVCMYCAGCGQMLTKEQTVCPQCGRRNENLPAGPANDAAQVYAFGRTILRLTKYWFLFACLNLALGVAGLVMARLGVTQHVGPWEPWPHPPLLEWTFLGASAWALLILRVALAGTASMALKDHAGCALPVTMVAAVVAMTQFPIGLLLGAFTLAKLVGKRSAALYARLS